MNKAERQHLSKVAELGCIICGRPAEIHHVTFNRAKGRKASHFEVIPLCPEHHRTGGHGVAFHAGKVTWQERYGTEEELLGRVNKHIL